MTKYQCDHIHARDERFRCTSVATMAFDVKTRYGTEIFFFCDKHTPTDFREFSRHYVIRDDELCETGISKQNRQENREPEPTPRDLAKEAIQRWEERKADEKWLRQIGVRP